MTPYWRNPWAAHAVYVPLIELARLIADGEESIRLQSGEIVPFDEDVFLTHVNKMGRRLDAYLLQPGTLSDQPIGTGVRYDHAGPRYHAYVVPERNRERVLSLMRSWETLTIGKTG